MVCDWLEAILLKRIKETNYKIHVILNSNATLTLNQVGERKRREKRGNGTIRKGREKENERKKNNSERS